MKIRKKIAYRGAGGRFVKKGTKGAKKEDWLEVSEGLITIGKVKRKMATKSFKLSAKETKKLIETPDTSPIYAILEKSGLAASIRSYLTKIVEITISGKIKGRLNHWKLSFDISHVVAREGVLAAIAGKLLELLRNSNARLNYDTRLFKWGSRFETRRTVESRRVITDLEITGRIYA